MTIEELRKEKCVDVAEKADGIYMSDKILVIEVADKIYAFELNEAQQALLGKKLDLNRSIAFAKAKWAKERL